MAKTAAQDTASLAAQIIEDVRKGIFKSVYLLMGEEPYYIDRVADAILQYAIPEEERDFNQTVCYGADVAADDVTTAAKRYPMFAERQLVMVKEAQMMKDYESLASYCERPLESTILVLCLRGAKADKRRGLYKAALKAGVVLESAPVPDYKMTAWIAAHYASLGLTIAPEAAALLAEYAGTDLGKVALETEKMRKNLPEGTMQIRVEDIEENIGLSRQMSVFELTKALSARKGREALQIAAHMATVKNFSLIPQIAMLYTHFYRILRYGVARHSLAPAERGPFLGVAPYFVKDYDAAVGLWSKVQCMNVIALLKEYDYLAKGGDGGDLDQAGLCVELISKILTQ